MIRIFLVLVILVGLMWAIAWLGRTNPAQRARVLKLMLLYGGIGILLALVVTGRVHWIFAALGALVPWIQRAIMAQRAYNMFKGWRGPTPGQKSDVETTYLRMVLDHDTGEMHGDVLEGTKKGRRLAELSFEELLELLDECRRADTDSVPLLESYLDRAYGDSWREPGDAGTGGDGSTASMSAAEAYEVLGLEQGATHEQIVEAHRRLMQKLHPDRGGSTYLAARINQAKDVLLGER